MSYTHNAEADFAASELARMFAADPHICYSSGTCPTAISSNASYEPSSSPWPKADALVSLLEPGTGTQRDIAVEYKRQQEGVHGLLTAIGQAHSYIHKGYSGAAIVVPSAYTTLSNPAQYVSDVLNLVSENKAIGVFRTEAPDLSSPTPYAGRLHTVRPLQLITTPSTTHAAAAHPKTQWVHMREGSTTRDAFFRFLQIAKRLSASEAPAGPHIPAELSAAIERLAPGRDPAAYLANTADDRFLTRVWRTFWFEWLATRDVLQPWKITENGYAPPGAFTKILKDDGSGFSQMFEGRADGLKENLAALLNAGEIDEPKAWELFAIGIQRTGRQKKQGIRDRAHSYREDLDSSLMQLRWIDSDGRPSDYGYRYMTICERYGGANSPAALEYVGASLLQTGRYGSFLHYVHRLSEQKFASDPLAFTRASPRGIPEFNEASYGEYLAYLEDRMADDLKVLRKVSGRSRPRVRTPFQAELTLLRNYGFVSKTRYRLGLGIPIDWEHVVQSLNIDL